MVDHGPDLDPNEVLQYVDSDLLWNFKKCYFFLTLYFNNHFILN